MTNKLNLKNDIIFKTFFSRKGNEEFLIDFLNSLLKIEIKSIDIRQEENLEQLSVSEKGGRLDLQAELNNGILVDIELQIRNNKDMMQRTSFYAAKLLSKETKRGTDYKDIKQVIVINLLDYEMLDFDEYISETAIVLNKHRDFEVLKEFKWYFIEFPKLKRQNLDMNEKINQWLAFIYDYNKELIKVAEEKNSIFQKARAELNNLIADPKVRRMAELREKWEMDRINEIGFAKREGIEQGIEQGEKRKQLQIAKKMLEKDMPIKLIAEFTGLTEDEIEKI